jgi:hypothetical protein
MSFSEPFGLSRYRRPPLLVFELGDGHLVGEVIALVVSNRESQLVARLVEGGPGRPRVLDAHGDPGADEAHAGVTEERTREEMRLGEDLEAVADAEDGAATFANSSSGPMTFAKRAMAPGLR